MNSHTGVFNMAVKDIIYFFIVSSIVIVESKVCTKQEQVVQFLTESYEKLSFVTYKSACYIDNIDYGSYHYAYYENYDTNDCVKSKWITIPATRTKQKLTTKIVKYCCEGYYREYSIFFGVDDFICVSVRNTTENSKEIMTELMTSTKSDGLEDTYGTESAYAITGSVVDQTTRRSDNTKETSKATNSMTSVTYGTRTTYTTIGSVIDQTTRITPDTRGISTPSESTTSVRYHPESTYETTDSIIDQTTTSSDFTNDTWNASERTWVDQYWPVVIIPLVLIIAVATLLVWRWTLIRIFLTGKYDVNDDKRTSQNACAKVQPTNSQTTTTIELNSDMQ